MANRDKAGNENRSAFQFTNPDPIQTAGNYGGEIVRVLDDGDSYKVIVRPFEIHDPDKKYSNIRGWIPKEKGNSVTEHFLKAFNNPKYFDEIEGKTATVVVGFKQDSENGETYANVVDYVV